MKRSWIRLFIPIVLSISAWILTGCQATTIKKIYYNDEPLFEYPHIVESDRIWIEDDPEVFYAFVRDLKDFLYEDVARSRFFVKRDDAVYMLWLNPIILDETTNYELRIERPMLAYGEAVAGGGWIKQYGEFPFPVHLLDGTAATEANVLPVAFEDLLAFYAHVKSAKRNTVLEWIVIDVGNAVVLLQKEDSNMVIRWIENTVLGDAKTHFNGWDPTAFMLRDALWLDVIEEDVPKYAEVFPDPELLMAQLLLLQASGAWNENAVFALPSIASHRIEWTLDNESFVLYYLNQTDVSFVALSHRDAEGNLFTVTFEANDIEAILEAIDALMAPSEN